MISRRTVGDRLVMSPMEPLVAGGAAEAFERHVQQLFRSGYRHLIVDLSGVPVIDSAGIRAFVRGHTSAQRVGGTLRLAAAPAAVSRVLELAHLAGVFEMYASVEAARMAAWPWRTIRIAVGWRPALRGARLGRHSVAARAGGISDAGPTALPGSGGPAPAMAGRPFLELLKLIVAWMIGLLVTAIHQPVAATAAATMEQAQTLLCVSGAMMMIIIGNNLARAFGIAGAASIIRFRTPVDDPKDVTILFLLMGLGMSTGLGQFAVAGLGTAFLCVALLLLDRMTTQKARVMSVEILAERTSVPDHARRKRVRPQSDRVRAARDLAVRRRDGEVPRLGWIRGRRSRT